MKISVIISSGNSLHHLNQYLNSVLIAAHKAKISTEIIVLYNNFSNNNSEVLPQMFPKVKFVKNPPKVITPARNYAFKYSSGDWLLFINSSVPLEKDFFLKIQENLNEDIFCVVDKYFLCKRGPFIVLNGFEEIYIDKESSELDFIYRGLKRGWKIIFPKDKLRKINSLPSKDYLSFIYKNITSNKLLFFMFIRRIFSFNFLKVKKIFSQLKEKRKIEKINSVIEDKSILNRRLK